MNALNKYLEILAMHYAQQDFEISYLSRDKYKVFIEKNLTSLKNST